MRVNGNKQISLLDTGASISAISEKLAQKLKLTVIAAPRTPLLSASNQVLETLGSVEVTINLDGLKVPFEFAVIPKLCNDLILGIDFLNLTKAVIDVYARIVNFYDGLVIMNTLNHVSAGNIARVVQNCILEPCSETAISVSLPPRDKCSRDTVDTCALIVEDLPTNMDKNFIVARSIAKITDSRTIIRILNPTQSKVILRKRQPIAQLAIIKTDEIATKPFFDNDGNINVNNNSANIAQCTDNAPNCKLNVHRLCNINTDVSPKASVPNVGTVSTEASENNLPNYDDRERQIDDDFDDPTETLLDAKILDDLKITLHDSLTVTQRNKLVKLLQHNEQVFSKGMHDLPGIDFYQHVIDTGDHRPIRSQPYKHTVQDNLEIDRQVEELLKAGHISPSVAIWASPCLLVTKQDNTKRLVIDYRKINQVISKISFPIALPTQIFDAVAENKAKYYSVLDMKSGYTQIPIAPESQDKTTFITSNGQFLWKRCPFGLSTSGSIFVAIVTNLFRNQAYQSCCVYVDDILIFSRTFNEHVLHLQNAFDTLSSVNLKLNASKCTFAIKEINYLGMTISEAGIAINPNKTAVVRNYPVPRNSKQVRQFLGFTNFYRKFVQNYAKIAHPLNLLLRKDSKFMWTTACQSAFEQLRDSLVKPPILAHPDMGQQFILTTDASCTAISYILSQADDQGRDRVICYGGRALRDAEMSFDVSQLECLALLHGIKENHAYLSHQHFLVYSDHSSLVYLRNIKNKNGRLFRWSLMLSAYSFDIKHKPGIINVADALSRIPYTPETRAQQKEAMNDDMYDKIRSIVPGTDENKVTSKNDDKNQSVNACSHTTSDLDFQFNESSEPDYANINETTQVNIEYDIQNTTILHSNLTAYSNATNSVADTNSHNQRSNKSMSYSHVASSFLPSLVPNITSNNSAHIAALQVNTSGARSNQHFMQNNSDTKAANKSNLITKVNSDYIVPIVNIAHAQRQCPELKRIFDYIQQDILPDDNNLARKTRFEAESYFIRDNLLMHIYAPRNLNLDTPRSCYEQVVVPSQMKNQILTSFHDDLGHPGFERMYASIRIRYYWPTMYNDIKDYALTCGTCQRNKRQYHAIRAPLCPLPIGDIFSRVHIDIIGILPEARINNSADVNTGPPYRYLLLVVDSFSKWVEAYPLRTQTSAEIAEVLFREFFTRFGFPNQINSDRGANLISRIMQHLCKICKVKRVLTSAYHQSANSAVERQVATLTAAIRCYITDQHEWLEVLPSILMAFRATVCTQSTEFSPYECCFGRIMRTATDVMLIPATGFADVDAYVQQLIPRLQLIRDIASDNSQQHQDTYKKIFDRNTAEVNLREGSKHWLFMPESKKGVNKKLRALYQGPVYITQQVSDTNYTVRDCKTNKPLAYSVHRSRLKPCREYRETFDYNELTQFNFDDDAELLSSEVAHYEEVEEEGEPDPRVTSPQPSTSAGGNTVLQNEVDEEFDERESQTNVEDNLAGDNREDVSLQETQNHNPEETVKQNTVMHEATEIIGVKTQNRIKYFRVRWKDPKLKCQWVEESKIPERLIHLFYIKRTKTGKMRKDYKKRSKNRADTAPCIY